MIQPVITREALEGLPGLQPRRYRLADWGALRAPKDASRDHSLAFPFRETFQNLIRGCPGPTIELRDGSGGRPYAYLRHSPVQLDAVKAWLATLSSYVVCRDLLAVSLALDYDREQGKPGAQLTLAAGLRKRAKPYDRAPTSDSYASANHLAGLMLDAVRNVACYDAVEIVLPMPPSASDKDYDLPRLLAGQLAARWGRMDGARSIRTIRGRPGLKSLPVAKKLDALQDSFEIDAAAVSGRTVLLVDDLYQSGLSMNFVAMKLQEAGARAILGLAVEKTCRNDDNTVRP